MTLREYNTAGWKIEGCVVVIPVKTGIQGFDYWIPAGVYAEQMLSLTVEHCIACGKVVSVLG